MRKVTYANRELLKKIKKSIKVSVLGAMIVLSVTGCGNSIEGATAEEMLESVFNQEKVINEQENGYLCLNYSDATNEDLNTSLLSSTTDICLNTCTYITSLDMVPELCPNLESITLLRCSSITDLSFIYKLNNLKSVYITESAFVTPELVQYLNAHGITHNITEKDLANAQKVDEIISNIITDDMDDIDKIRAISIYVMDNLEYDLDNTERSNSYPLDCALNDKKCVCAGYAYLTNVLLRKAGIESYQISNTEHTWNIIKEDDKYYYLDVTNLDANNKIAFKYFNNTPLFMSDPGHTNLTVMTDYDAGASNIVIPKSMIEDIEAGEDLKTLNEKYGTGEVAFLIKFVLPMLGINLGVKGGKGLANILEDEIEKDRKRRLREKEARRKEKKREKELKEREKELREQYKKEKRQREIEEEKAKETPKVVVKVNNDSMDVLVDSEKYEYGEAEEKQLDLKLEPESELTQEPKPEPELTEYELFIREMSNLYDEIQIFRHNELYEYYMNFMVNNPNVSFIDYLKNYSPNKDINGKIVDFEVKKQEILKSVYEEFLTKSQIVDLSYFKNYCENYSKLIKDLGGYGLIIQDYDLESFISNMMDSNLEKGKLIS